MFFLKQIATRVMDEVIIIYSQEVPDLRVHVGCFVFVRHV